MTVDWLLARLQRLKTLEGGDKPAVLIVGGIAYPIDDVWWEPRQGGTGAVCVGEDPR